MKRMNKQLQKGFTLLELLVVVSILAIIAGAVISAISGQEERAGQSVALNTMGALENAVRQQSVINGGLPDGLDSLICADLDSLVLPTNDISDITGAEIMGASAGGEGGLAPGLLAKVAVATLPAGDCEGAEEGEGACVLLDAGIDTLRYAEVTVCDDDIATNPTTGVNGETIAVTEIDDVLANTLFWDASDEAGAGMDLNVLDDTATTTNGSPTASAVPFAQLQEPADIGLNENDIVGVFGIGNFTEMSESAANGTRIISRGPVDGNVAGDGQFYSHFSVAIRLAGSSDGTVANAVWDGNVDVVAILDSDGDNFDDEIAEYNGLEDE